MLGKPKFNIVQALNALDVCVPFISYVDSNLNVRNDLATAFTFDLSVKDIFRSSVSQEQPRQQSELQPPPVADQLLGKRAAVNRATLTQMHSELMATISPKRCPT